MYAASLLETRERILPVPALLEPILPRFQKGTVVVAESSSICLSLLSGISKQGGWCASVGLPALGLLAASEAGINLERFVLVPHPFERTAEVIAALADTMDAVLIGPKLNQQQARRLAARARQRGSVLIAQTDWPQPDLRLEVVSRRWMGLHQGWGYLTKGTLEVECKGRGAAAMPRRATIPA